MAELRIEQDGLPMRLRGVRVRRDGTLAAAHDRTVQRFRFRWRGVEFVARYRQDGQGARLRYAADFGPLPYATQAPDTNANLRAIVDAAREHLGPVARIRRDRRIIVGRRVPLETPVTADRLMATLATELLAVAPYLDLLKDHRAA
ncbi:hypothetical protein C882_0768 [Caenispirillum salinarum AK4]|uniref:Uncharacterized protein n=1 Tax=Caenispirillum salinarum AK4 TaxID=1238182 RepID=K9GTQ5_9PROT|nr:hypothetical protein [Caenispirillum salinarum]EKV28557.1 hypothetical protein C882_0768 [Caenispirillum salinarum AK4]